MKEHELWNELGNLYFLAGSYDRAIRAYNHAVDLNPESGEPRTNLALTYAQLGKFAEASAFYQQGIPLLKDELDRAVSLHKLGDIHFHLKQFPQAAEVYQQTEELMPDLDQIIADNKPADFLLHCPPSESHLQQAGYTGETSPSGDFDFGKPPFVEELTPWWFDDQTVPSEEPDTDIDFWCIDYTGIHGSNESTISTEPLMWEAALPCEEGMAVDNQQLVSVSNDGTRNYSDVQDTVDVERNESKNGLETNNTIITTSNNQEDEVAADDQPVVPSVMVITDKPEIITDSPEFSSEDITNPDAVQYEIPVDWPVVELSQQEQLEIQAEINRFKRVLEINPRNAFAWDSIGGNYKALGQYEDAIDAYRKAASLDSTKAFYFHHLGLVFAAVGRYDEAIDAFERVIEVDPNHSLAHATLGGYYRKKGNEELAKEHIEKARNLIANDENEYNRACMEAICGNTDHSLELLELALKNKQAYVNWARKDPDLDFIRSDPRFHALLAEHSVKVA